jgi:hypothetical protein
VDQQRGAWQSDWFGGKTTFFPDAQDCGKATNYFVCINDVEHITLGGEPSITRVSSFSREFNIQYFPTHPPVPTRPSITKARSTTSPIKNCKKACIIYREHDMWSQGINLKK